MSAEPLPSTAELPLEVYKEHGINFVSREAWGARTTKDATYMPKLPVGIVFIHHLAGPEDVCDDPFDCLHRVKAVQDFHMDGRGWDDIGYNFLVGEDGRVYEGRGWRRTGAHTLKFNNVAIAIAIAGNYSKIPPNDAALNTTKKTIDLAIEKQYITKDYALYGHRDSPIAKTECPGEALYSIIKTWEHYRTEQPSITS